MKDKSIFITGANGGLGFETSKLLAQQNVKRLVLAARTDKKTINAKARLEQAVISKSNIETAGGFDMNDPKSIEKAVAALPLHQPFDIIFLQAGGVIFDNDYQYISHAGKQIEKTIFQNAIGGYITLVNLIKHNLVAPNARIVFAGGEGARGIAGMIEKPVFEDETVFLKYVNGSGNLPKYNPMNAIGVSKLTSAFLVQKLAELSDGHAYIWFTPGLTHGTNGLAAQSPIRRFIAEKIVFSITSLFGLSQSPQKGAKKYVDALLGKYGSNGAILGAPEGKVLGKIVDQKSMNATITNGLVIEAFWKFLQEVYPMPSAALA